MLLVEKLKYQNSTIIPKKSHPVAPDATAVWYNEITPEIDLIDLK